MKSKKNKMISLCVGGLLNLLSCSVQTFSMKTRERRQLALFCVPICKIEDRCHVMDQSVIIIRRTFFEVIECVFYIQPIGISEKNYKVMT